MWKRSHGRTSEAPPDERGGYRYVRPTATASHLDSTHLARCRVFRRRSLHRTHSGRSPWRRERLTFPDHHHRNRCLFSSRPRYSRKICGDTAASTIPKRIAVLADLSKHARHSIRLPKSYHSVDTENLSDISSFDLLDVLECVKLIRRVLGIFGTGALISCLFLSAVWANLAIAYQLPQSTGVRIGACLALNFIALAALVAIIRRRHWRAVFIYAVAYAILLAWSASIRATNDKNWAAEVAHGVTGVIDGDQLSFATFATSVGALKPITRSIGNSGYTICQNYDRSICFWFIGWDRRLPTRL